jgi:hypothetical protein
VSKGRKAQALKTLAYYHANGDENNPLVQYGLEEIKAQMLIGAVGSCSVGSCELPYVFTRSATSSIDAVADLPCVQFSNQFIMEDLNSSSFAMRRSRTSWGLSELNIQSNR